MSECNYIEHHIPRILAGAHSDWYIGTTLDATPMPEYRKPTLLVMAALLSIGIVLEASAVTSFWQLVVGRTTYLGS
jgi:MFS family permease